MTGVCLCARGAGGGGGGERNQSQRVYLTPRPQFLSSDCLWILFLLLIALTCINENFSQNKETVC